MKVTILFFLAVFSASGGVPGGETNAWIQVSEDAVGPRHSPGLVWSDGLGRFVLFGGAVSHQFQGQRPYDIQTFDVASRQWFNHLPQQARSRGGETGNVEDPGYKSPYFAMVDNDGLVAPNRRHTVMWYKYACAPWDGKIYSLVCGRTLCYDLKLRQWRDLQPETGPSPPARSYKGSLAWGAMCADGFNEELVLFGGCGLNTERAGPGTWVYSTEKNQWRKLQLDTQPPVRVLSPMVYDPAAKKIVLFGGDRLDQLYADTWVYDCQTRTWEERRPAVSPSPRFGHALLYLPKSKTIVLLGGKGYTSSCSYRARLYQPLPFEMWTYDVSTNKWSMWERLEQGGPPQIATAAACAAAGDDDRVLWVGLGTERSRPGGPMNPHSSWLARLDPGKTDPQATAEFGVAPGTLKYRIGPYDPAYYVEELPEPDRQAQAKLLEQLPANRWVALDAPRWPHNRMGGGWSTVALDSDRDQILHLGGGHASYFGNDVAIYDIPTGRWSISCRPQFALEFNYDLSGPGPFAFNLGPWGNHNYHAYCYDPAIQRIVYMKHMAQLFNPTTKSWAFDEKIPTPFEISKYTTYVLPTPAGVVAWTHIAHQKCGLFRFEDGKQWRPLPVKGELPVTVCDGAAAAHDSRRDQLVMVTTQDTKNVTVEGQVWTYDFPSGVVTRKDPTNMGALKTGRFAREAVYLPDADLLMLGYILDVDGQKVVPFYDCEDNQWLVAELPGSDFIAGERGCSVDLGLVYDAKRGLIWGVKCELAAQGALNVLRFDRETAAVRVLR
jgi:hypothetical protein